MLNERYKVLVPLGVGGMARTYLVEDTQSPDLAQYVLKKLITSSDDAAYLEIAKRLFRREAKALQQLGKHDAIPGLVDYFEQDHEFYLVQDLIEGEPLKPGEIEQGKQWSEAQTTAFLKEILDILEFVHSNGVIHRDIKPSNIMRRRSDGKLMLIDFGSVKEIQVASTEVAAPDPSPVSESPSADAAAPPRTIVGTPEYMPEEQAQGDPYPSSDLHALGMVAIQAISGLSPKRFGRDAEGELVWRRYTEVSEGLAEILTKMVRRHHFDRYQSATAVLRALQGLNKTMLQTATAVVAAPEDPPQDPPKKKKGLPLWAKFMVFFAALTALAGLGYWGWTWYSQRRVLKAEQTMLAELDALFQTGKYPECREQARTAIATPASTYTSANYPAQLQERQARCALGEANTLADKNQLRDAMLVLADIAPKTNLYDVAQAKIKNYGKEICTWALNSAENANDRVQFGEILRNGRSVPDFYPDKKKCQADLLALEKAWDENVKPFKAAQEALKQGQCQKAETSLKSFVGSRFKYWKTVSTEQQDNLKKCQTPLSVKGRLADSSPTRTFTQGAFSRELPFEQHEFKGFKGQKILIKMTSRAFSPHLYLYDPTGSLLKQNASPKVSPQPSAAKPSPKPAAAKPAAQAPKPKTTEPKQPNSASIVLTVPKNGTYKLFVTKALTDPPKSLGQYQLSATVQ